MTFTCEATEPTFGCYIGEVNLINVHNPELCAGRACVIHAPSDHHMRDWTLVWRADKRQFERSCPNHGVGHPDPDDLAWHVSQGREWVGIHGCCGCCHAG